MVTVMRCPQLPSDSRISRRWVPHNGDPTVTLSAFLLALEDEANLLVPRPDNAGHQGAIRGKGVAFFSGRSRFTGRRHLKHVVIPPGLALEVFALMNRGVVLAVGHVPVKKGLAVAFIGEAAGDRDVALPLIDRHGAGLNDGLARKIALGRRQRPGAVHCGVVVASEGGGREERGYQDGSRNRNS